MNQVHFSSQIQIKYNLHLSFNPLYYSPKCHAFNIPSSLITAYCAVHGFSDSQMHSYLSLTSSEFLMVMRRLLGLVLPQYFQHLATSLTVDVGCIYFLHTRI